MTTLAELLGLRLVTPYTNGKAAPREAADPRLLMGLELEIENVPNWEELTVAGMTSTEDGSLRNNGREFITQPSTYSIAMHTLQRFFERGKFTEANYSERCSIHVHANCQDLTREQIGALCMLYQVYERLLFGFVGEDRDKNIFCIPWDQTTLTYNVVNYIEKDSLANIKQWQKYTALNLLPLFSQGTVEFRHMPGTCDLEKIGIWLNLIGAMFAYVRRYTMAEIKEQFLQLNTTSQYDDLTNRVFTFWTKHLLKVPNYKMVVEEGVLNMKYSMLNPYKAPQTKKLSPYYQEQATFVAHVEDVQQQLEDAGVDAATIGAPPDDFLARAFRQDPVPARRAPEPRQRGLDEMEQQIRQLAARQRIQMANDRAIAEMARGTGAMVGTAPVQQGTAITGNMITINGINFEEQR